MGSQLISLFNCLWAKSPTHYSEDPYFRIIFSEIFDSDVQNQNRQTPSLPTYRLKNAIEFPILKTCSGDLPKSRSFNG